MPAPSQYLVAIYFIVTTISTVGYGDISGSTTAERVFCIVLMVVGVFSFTFISGALASILSNFDASQAALNEKLMFLQKLRSQHNLRKELYADIRAALNFDHQRKIEGLENFIESLPLHLKLEVSMEIHRDIFSKHSLFSTIGNKNFLSWVGSRLKPLCVNEN